MKNYENILCDIHLWVIILDDENIFVMLPNITYQGNIEVQKFRKKYCTVNFVANLNPICIFLNRQMSLLFLNVYEPSLHWK